MFTRRFSASTILVALLAQTSVSLAQQVLLEPNWDDAELQTYLASRGSEAPPLPGEPEPFNLPVLGLDVSGNAAPPPMGKSLEELLPDCAADEPVVAEAARDDSGSWYTLNYDWGCLAVSINGDRTSETDPGNAAPIPDGISGVDVTDEGEPGDAVSEVSVFVNRFGLPYLVSVECIGDIKDFCQDQARVVDLVSILVPVDGQP